MVSQSKLPSPIIPRYSNGAWDTECYSNRLLAQTSLILTFANIFESFLIVIKPEFPELTVIVDELHFARILVDQWGYGKLFKVCNQKLDDIRIPGIALNGDRIAAKRDVAVQ